jgi:hypothetical protein
MKRYILYIAFFLCQIQLYSQNLEYAKEVVSTLASPEFKGRGYVGNGNTIAAHFISDEFKKIGLKKFKVDYFQPFQINVNTFPKDIKLKLDTIELVPGVDFIVDPTSPSIDDEFEVYVINKEELADDNIYLELDKHISGKILVVDERNYTVTNKDLDETVSKRLNYLKYVDVVPTYATIIVTSKKITWSNATIQFKKPVVTVKSDIDISSLKNVTLEIDAEFIKYNTNNVIGYIEGTEVPDSFLVVTAHYDHLGKMGKDTYFPGANDNASGVAMILSLAKYFQNNPPKYSVAFIALSAEEIGIIGAKYYTENPVFDLEKIKFLVNFDLAGTGDDGIKVVNGSIYKEKFERLTAINEAGDLLKSVQIRGEACNSDHCMFYRKGVPCFYIYTLGGISAYHDVYDKAETLPLSEFEDYSKLMIEFFDSF